MARTGGQQLELVRAALGKVEAFLREVAWLKDLFLRAQRLGLGEGEEVQQAIQEFQAALDLLHQGGEHEERGLVDSGRRRL